MHHCDFTWYLWKVRPALGMLGVLASLYIFMHAQFTGYHYIVDLFAGMVLAAVSVVLAEWVTDRMLALREHGQSA